MVSLGKEMTNVNKRGYYNQLGETVINLESVISGSEVNTRSSLIMSVPCGL